MRAEGRTMRMPPDVTWQTCGRADAGVGERTRRRSRRGRRKGGEMRQKGVKWNRKHTKRLMGGKQVQGANHTAADFGCCGTFTATNDDTTGTSVLTALLRS